MNLKEIQHLIKFVAKSGASEVKLEMNDVKITIKTASESEAPLVQYTPITPTAAPQMPMPIAEVKSEGQAQPPSESTNTSKTPKHITVKSPIIGTFYRRASPDKPLFVEVGQTIAEGDVLCVIEAMKLFNEIESEVSGKIVEVLVEDASPVEFDQPLFIIDPS